ncbi:MAG: hypothetical protein AMXMBFR4_23460 [Candidatus Hydrogenedentota bacterium]
MRGEVGRAVGSFAVLVLFFAAIVPSAYAEEAADPFGAAVVKIENFRLLDHNGRSHELYAYGADAKAIVLFSQGNGCPIARKLVPTMKAIRDEFAPKGVIFLFINGDPIDGRPDIAKEADEFAIDLPILKDETQLVVRRLGYQRTCDAMLIDPKTWTVVYRGAVDDQYDYIGTKPAPTKRWLVDALNAYLEGKPVAEPRVEPKGCLITYDDLPQAVSYVKDIAPLIRDRCADCHSPGSVAPFAFDSHRQVVGRASMIREVVLTQRMPPWHADPLHGRFLNDRSLSKTEIRKLFAWLEAGAPKDGDADPLEDVANLEHPEWPLGKPDLIVQLPEPQTIPASGVLPYAGVGVKFPLGEDKWVRAVDVRPTNRAVVHHALVFLSYPEHLKDQEPDYMGGTGGYFAGYVPGAAPLPFPEGSGKLVPAGSTFEFQLHYVTTGKQETDQTQLGLYFCSEKPAQVYATRAASNTRFEIPPGAYDHETKGEHYIWRDSLLWSMAPHMHYRGSRMAYIAKYPDGNTETLLSVPNYRFDWQTQYRLQEPKNLPAGTVIEAVGAWDNSARNAFNPDPTATVRFGEQTDEEMFIGYLNYSYDPDSPVVRPQRRGNRDEGIRTGIPLNAENLVDTEWTGGQYTFLYGPDGELTVNGTIKGTYTIEGNKVKISVAGIERTFYLHGDVITPDDDPDGFHFRRIK